MYIVCFYSNKYIAEIVCSDANSLSAIVNILENNKTPFKVSHRMGVCQPNHFRWGKYHYWKERNYIWE